MEEFPDWIVSCPMCNTEDYLMGMHAWTKYSYVCTNCDALIEVTTNVAPVIDPACICNPSTYVVRTALEPTVQPIVMSITPTQVVKINSNPYN
jgi:hypothetical protein